MFQAAKNLMVSKGAQIYVNKLIARYGTVRDLVINPQMRTVEITCTLHGETQPLSVRIERYEVFEKNGKKFAEISRCSCSRPWTQNLIDDFVIGKQVELPGWAGDAL